MSTLPTLPSHRLRLYSHMTQSAFFHVQSALEIGKLHLFAGSYPRGGGKTTQWLHHYLDVPDARVLCRALLTGSDYSYSEYKGTPLPGGRAESRVLKVNVKGDKAFLELSAGPGTLTRTGAITPSKVDSPQQPRKVITIVFTPHQVRRMAEEILAFLQAWDVIRLSSHRALLGPLPEYGTYPLADGERSSISA